MQQHADAAATLVEVGCVPGAEVGNIPVDLGQVAPPARASPVEKEHPARSTSC
jgi:hypothetical protein